MDDLLHDDDRDDKRNLPVFLPSHVGRTVSLKGLLERIMEQFNNEFDASAPAWQAADTPVKKRALLRDVVDYVITVEHVALTLKEKSEISQLAYSELCAYSGLDSLFAHPDITTILIEGADKLAVRYAIGTEIIPLVPIFDDSKHLTRIITRLLAHANAEPHPDTPIIETGLTINGRPVSVNVVFPPTSAEITADVRVHPATLPTFADLVRTGYLDERARAMLEAIARSDYGFVVVGDTESGKTTLLNLMAHLLPNASGIVSVERAGEMRLPDGATQKRVQWRTATQAPRSFAECVQDALELAPTCLLLDEVRADDAEALAPLLAMDNAPRQAWAFRGTAEAKRMKSALSMTARMADRSQPEAMVDALYRRLPFVISVKRRKGWAGLQAIGEWQYPDGSPYPDYVPLLVRDDDGALSRTSHRSARLEV
jgi:pilus assembly protein CpaF